MHANAPHDIVTHQGTFSLEVQVVDSDRNRREVPIVDIRVSILPGPVKDPELLFGNALREAYALATQFINLRPNPDADSV